MQIQAIGQKDGFLTSLESTGDDLVPFNVCPMADVPDDVVRTWINEILEMSGKAFCFSGATPLDNDDPFKLLWIANTFFDEEPKISADFDISEYADNYDPAVDY